MQTASFRFWTQVPVSISYNDDRYTTTAFKKIFTLILIWRKNHLKKMFISFCMANQRDASYQMYKQRLWHVEML